MYVSILRLGKDLVVDDRESRPSRRVEVLLPTALRRQMRGTGMCV